MNENLNLVEKLKNVPAGTKLWSKSHGSVELKKVYGHPFFLIVVTCDEGGDVFFTQSAKLKEGEDCEVMLFPSKNQRDWDLFEYDPILVGTPCMVKNTSDWIFRFYAGKGDCFFDQEIRDNETFPCKEIIPVSEFDFENLCRKGERK